MKEVTITAFCDDPFETHEERCSADVTDREVWIDGRPVTLDLCLTDDNRLNVLFTRIVEIGEQVEGARPKRKPRSDAKLDGTPASYRTCPECGDEKPNRGALGQHLYQKHDAKLTEYEWAYNPRTKREDSSAA